MLNRFRTDPLPNLLLKCLLAGSVILNPDYNYIRTTILIFIISAVVLSDLHVSVLFDDLPEYDRYLKKANGRNVMSIATKMFRQVQGQ